MWAATLALNGLPVSGIGQFNFPNHLIEHALSALYDIAHGAGLSIVIPGWMKYASKQSPAKFAQFAERVFGIQEESPEKAAEKGIEALKAWFDKIGSPTSLAAANICSSLSTVQGPAMITGGWLSPNLTPPASTMEASG